MTLLVIVLLMVILALSIGMIALGQQQNRLEKEVLQAQENDISLLTEIEELKTVVARNRRAVRYEQSIIDSKQNVHFIPGFNATATASPYYTTAEPLAFIEDEE